MARISIGVAIASFNGRAFIKEQLESICRQSLMPELISISDDGSEDGTREFLEEFKSRCKIPVVINYNPKRLGVIENFLEAFRRCDTDYIAYCDQDDVWDETKLASCGRILASNQVALIFHRSMTVNQNLQPLGYFSPYNIRRGLYAFPYFPDTLWGFGHQMIFSRRVLEVMIRIVRSRSGAVAAVGTCFDYSLLVAAGMVGNIYFLDEELMKFRRHDRSVSQAGNELRKVSYTDKITKRREKILEVSQTLDALISEVSEYGLLEGSDSQQRNLYVAQLRRLQGRYERRKTIYNARSVATKLLALAALTVSGTYGSMHRNKLTPRQLIVDFAQSVTR